MGDVDFELGIAVANWRKDTDHALLVSKAQQAKSDGNSSDFLSGWGFTSEFELVLGGSLEFDKDIPELERNRIASRVSQAARDAKAIDSKLLLAEASKQETAYLRLPKVPYRLLTEISLGTHLKVPMTRVNGVTLCFAPSKAIGFNKREEAFRAAKSAIGISLPAEYLRVSAHVRARSTHEAVELSLNCIDLARASWNLAVNRGKSWRFSTGRPAPVNDIRLSPFHTLHKLDGSLATDSWWYDPGYARPTGIYSQKQEKFDKLLAFSVNVRGRLNGHPYQDDLEGALIRYVRALDSSDLNDTFLRLWSLLEYLTDSTHDPYKVAARRAAFMFVDQERSRLVLTHLTNHRNRFVHTGSDTNRIEDLVFLLKRYVDALLLFHIGTRIGFTTRRDAALFMDLPSERAKIDEKIKILKHARRYISGGNA